MGKKLFFSFLLFGALSFVTADSLFGLLRASGSTVTVPDYRGMNEDDISAPDWMQIETDYRYDAGIPAGTVMEQTPAAGTPYKVSDRRHCEMHLTVSLGMERMELPDVVGKDIREAANLLRRSGFSVREETVAGGVEGVVQRTDPPAGEILPSGSTVTVYVSVGESTEVIEVPDFVGMSRGNALLQIFLSGLSAGDVTEEFSGAPEGTVIRHSPSAGSLVRPGTAVRIVVSKQKLPEENTRNQG